MNKFMAKGIFLTSVLVIFMGLSVSASEYASKYDFGSKTVLPSEKAALDAGIFSNDIGSTYTDDEGKGTLGDPQRGIGGGGDDPIDPGDGGGEDCPGCYNDSPVGNGVYILITLLAAYGGVLFYRRKKTVNI